MSDKKLTIKVQGTAIAILTKKDDRAPALKKEEYQIVNKVVQFLMREP